MKEVIKFIIDNMSYSEEANRVTKSLIYTIRDNPESEIITKELNLIKDKILARKPITSNINTDLLSLESRTYKKENIKKWIESEIKNRIDYKKDRYEWFDSLNLPIGISLTVLAFLFLPIPFSYPLFGVCSGVCVSIFKFAVCKQSNLVITGLNDCISELEYI